MKFLYQAVDDSGQRRSDTLDAVDREAAAAELARRGWDVLRLLEVGEAPAPAPAADPRLASVRRQVERAREELQGASRPLLEPALDPRRQLRLESQALLLLTSQLSVLLEAGIGLVTALDTLSDDVTTAGKLAGRLSAHLQHGQTLSSGLALYPRIFDPIYVRLVQGAEQTGRLGAVFASLSATLQRRAENRGQVVRALIYPAALLAFSGGLTLFMFCYMLPRFLETFRNVGPQLPALTRVLLALTEQPLLLYGVPAGAAFALGWLWLARDTLAARRFMRYWAFRLPLVGPLNQARALSQLCGDLADLHALGIPLTQSLKLLVGTTGSPQLDAGLAEARALVEAGETLARALERAGFSRLLVSTVAAAEPSGQLDRFLGRIGQMLAWQVEADTEQALQLVEPAILAALGLVVGTLVLAIFLPVYQLATLAL